MLRVLPGCPKPPAPTPTPDVDRPLPPGQLALRKITDPADLPDFTPGLKQVTYLRSATEYSIEYLNKASSNRFFPYGEITHENALASAKAFHQIIADVEAHRLSPEEANSLIRERFDVYESVGYDDHGRVRFTGYYTPVIYGSLKPQGKYVYPLYGLPKEHQVTEKGTVAMTTCDRRAIEQGNLLAGKGLELVYLDDPFMVFVVQVQGSAKIKLVDENNAEAIFGFAGTNGYDYKSIRKEAHQRRQDRQGHRQPADDDRLFQAASRPDQAVHLARPALRVLRPQHRPLPPRQPQ